ncbi:MAG: SPOR domain-containing protein [Hyphomicrobiaceae bacterium]
MARVHATLAALVVVGIAIAMAPMRALAQSPPPATPKSAAEPAKKPAPPKKKAAAPAGETKDAAASKPDPAAVQKQLDAAQKSLDAGKLDVAVNQANAVVGQAGIDAKAMARALVIRGLGYKKQGKPAQAMSDLQSALYIKGGLNDADRAAATQARIEAYKEAGLPEPQPIGAATKPGAPVATNVQTASTARAPEPAKPAPTPPPTSGSGGGFLSSLFGGGAPAAPTAPKAAPTAPTTPVAAPPPAPAAPETAAKAASKTPPPARATVAQAAPAAVTPPAAAPSAPTPVAAPATAGRFRLLIEGARSRQEAMAAIERVKKDHAGDVTGRNFEIEEAAFGNMGTFYRVRVGPYADAKEPSGLCATLRGKGIDCRVATQ